MLRRSSKIFWTSRLLRIIFLLSVVTAFLINPLILFVKKLSINKKGEIQLHVPNLLELVNKHANYRAFEYFVETEDGYILRLHRMQYSGESEHHKNSSKTKPVMFLQHGFLMSSDSFVLRGPGEDLAFLLAESGHDVWLGNVRGNVYSKTRKIKSRDSQSSFFDFSIHEHGVYDLKAMIDFVINETCQENVGYLGYSMGTTMGFVLLTQYPEYNQKIRAFYNLAPLANFGKELSPVGAIAVVTLSRAIEVLHDFFGMQELYVQMWFRALLADLFLNGNALLREMCVNASFKYLMMSDKTATEMLPYMLVHCPAGSSYKVVKHFFENYKTGRFEALDYGHHNLIKYGHSKPPVYDLTKVTTRVSIWYSINDQLINYKDVEFLMEALPNVVSAKKIEDKEFDHMEFLYSTRSKVMIYKQILQEDKLYLEGENEII